MSVARRELLLWAGGALLVVLGVALWLVLTSPAVDLLPVQYRFGIL